MTPAKTNYGSITIFGWLHVWKIRQLTLDQLTPADLKLEGISDSTQTIAEFTAEHFPDIPTTTAVFDVTEGGQKKTKVVFLVRFKFLSAQSALPENVLELHNVWGSEEACQCKVCNACGLGNAGNHTCSVCNRCVHSGFDVDCSTWKGIDKEHATYTCAPCGALTSDQEKVKDPPQEKEKDKVEEEKKERDKEKEEEKKKDSAHKEKEEEKKEQQQESEQPQEQEQQQESEQPQDQEQQQESEQ